MTKLHLLSLCCVIGLSTPALAQISLTLPDSSSAPATDTSMGLSLAPDDSTASDDQTSMSDDTSGTDESDASDDTDVDVSTGPAVPSKDALADFLKSCTDVSSGDPKAYDRANADGWVPDDQADSGPYRKIYSGAKDVGGYGSVTIWGSVDTYPTQMLGYCRVDFGDYDSNIDLNDLNGLQGLSGAVTGPDSNSNEFGAWETADKKLLVIADRTDGQVEIEFNLLLGDKK